MPQTTRPGEITTADAEKIARSLTIKSGNDKETRDPLFRYVLNWGLGIVAALVTVGWVTVISLVMSTKDQMLILVNRPEAATKLQLDATNVQLGSLQKQANDMQEQIRDMRLKLESRK